MKNLAFQWLTGLAVNLKNAGKYADAGRGRWCIENQGFNIQKNVRYDIHLPACWKVLGNCSQEKIYLL